MKRSSVIGILGLVGLGIVYLASCSEPLDVNSSPSYNPPARVDTVYIFDTLTPSDTAVRVDTIRIHDTMIQHDTVRQIDTTVRFDTVHIVDPHYIYDTVMLVDTVTIVVPDVCEPEPFCGELSSCDKDLIWMFRNEAGDYRLEFSGYAEKDQPLQTIIVNIDGTDYEWQAATDPLWITELNLPANTTITIGLTKPLAYGHAISICLKMTKL
jgi:hypothetical protein